MEQLMNSSENLAMRSFKCKLNRALHCLQLDAEIFGDFIY